ncbi:MAG: hypothetical protein KKE36_04565 [Actinobacteria bacterium]|nr:hypothetical protein [Actinomycetota bacterium]
MPGTIRFNRVVRAGLAAVTAVLLACGCGGGGAGRGVVERGESISFLGVAVAGEVVWAVGTEGDRGAVFRYDGSWETVRTADETLTGVSASGDDVWVAGVAGSVLHFDGRAWTAWDLEVEGGLYCVSSADGVHVWVAGDLGVVYYFDGTGWTIQDTPVRWNIKSVSAVDPEHVWAVGAGGILFFNGRGWTLQYGTEGGGAFSGLSGVAAPDPTHAWACGTTDGGGTFSILSWDGKDWKKAHSTGDLRLVGICAIGPSSVYAASTEGFVYSAGGAFHTKRVLEDTERETLNGISASSVDEIWAVGTMTEIRYRTLTAFDRPVAVRLTSP